MALSYSYFNLGSKDTKGQKSRAVSSGNKSQSAVDPDYKDPVKQDQVWREFVHAELEGARQWQKNWSFLKNYDQLGRLREEKALPTYVTVFSDKVPNTMNQTFGNRMNTDIGQALIHMDSILLRGNRKKKLSQDMLPC
ncbi:uncharacterized protein C2orf50 homolog isoform X2 [Lepisosteus oculatus]|uniref:uncharacterized protein C2orf50 homolog isoform X2 n=1 Tax=Lepisosteus oculatus TaxID=7918 RepID=UPI00073FC8BF|nr:PREDICTED: uncharacterized protein C2orf50 homolog isoform X2 [Lepisosteus oculatus]